MSSTQFSRILYCCVLLTGWACKQPDPCQLISYESIDANAGINLDHLLRPIDSLEYQQTLTAWRNFNPSSNQHELVDIVNFGSRSCLIYAHQAAGQLHYGALFLPADYDASLEAHYPLILWATGLDQSRPAHDISPFAFPYFLVNELPQYFVLIPGFRGQSLIINRKSYCSEGFFGDAYAGATDDALRFLKLVRDEYPSIDAQRMAVYGVSRGGTVAMLAGLRSPDFRCVISVAGPSDFLSPQVAQRYSKQYQYQFLNQVKPLPQLRQRIIESSPLHFINELEGYFLLIQGRQDPIVPSINAESIKTQLTDQSKFTYWLLEGDHGVPHKTAMLEWLRAHMQ